MTPMCLLAVLMEATTTLVSTGTVRIGAYPGLPTSTSRGTVMIKTTKAGITISGTLSGLESSKTGGFHIHTGTTCSDAALVGGHFYTGSTDPWTDIRYSTGSCGSSTIKQDMHGFSLTGGSLAMLGRAFVVHNSAGARVGCGIIQDTTAEYAAIAAYPGTAGTSTVSGTMIIEDESSGGVSGISLTGTLIGLEQSTDGGIHIHTGTTCSEASAVGGHFYTGSSDPWTGTLWTSGSAGAAQVSLTMSSFSLLTTNAVNGRALVVHDHAGNRIGCGLIGPTSTAQAAQVASTCEVLDLQGTISLTGFSASQVSAAEDTFKTAVAVGVSTLSLSASNVQILKYERNSVLVAVDTAMPNALAATAARDALSADISSGAFATRLQAAGLSVTSASATFTVKGEDEISTEHYFSTDENLMISFSLLGALFITIGVAYFAAGQPQDTSEDSSSKNVDQASKNCAGNGEELGRI